MVIRAAKEAHVAPWDMAGVPESAGHECWVTWTIWAQNAEVRARNAEIKRQQQRQKARR